MDREIGKGKGEAGREEEERGTGLDAAKFCHAPIFVENLKQSISHNFKVLRFSLKLFITVQPLSPMGAELPQDYKFLLVNGENEEIVKFETNKMRRN